MPDSWNLPPASRYPALDFLRQVEIWQQTPGGTAGIVVPMPEGDEATLDQLLTQYREGRALSSRLEEQARYWLIGYREMAQGVLSNSQRAQLNSVIDGMPAAQPPSPQQPRSPGSRRARRRLLIAAIAVVAAPFIAFGIVTAVHSANPDNPLQNGPASQSQPQQVAPGSTDLEQFQADWGPFRNVAASEQNPQTGGTALLLLNQGGYYVSDQWTVPDAKDTWTADLGGHVQSVNVHGRYAVITDADGTIWVTGIEQPFVFGTDPNTVLKIDHIGTVLSTTTTHATSIRVRI